ncbi:hypothetical protein ACFWAR_01330 [Streptomyces sp. NPDC059917]|uniref:hypothetical protein n=1 Tax=Streptomyces sp. NPDC059917 TaxID=3347002 RepID=UPI0036580437
MIKGRTTSVCVAAFLSLFAGSASAAPLPPPPPPEGWISLFRTIGGKAESEITHLPHSANSDDLSRLTSRLNGLSDQLASAPRDQALPSEELAALIAARAAQDRLRAAVDYLSIPSSTDALVDSLRSPYMPSTYTADWLSLKNDLKKNAEGYIKQFACEKSWDALTPEKKQELQPLPAEYFTNASEETVKKYVDAVFKTWKSTLVGQYVAWNNYGTDLFKKMEQFFSQGHLAAPPQAYFYYARYCLTPPIPPA